MCTYTEDEVGALNGGSWRDGMMHEEREWTSRQAGRGGRLTVASRTPWFHGDQELRSLGFTRPNS